ncbi:hypothetical protein AusDCA_2303 [Desulfitobacterium sp. AusDCA]
MSDLVPFCYFSLQKIYVLYKSIKVIYEINENTKLLGIRPKDKS